jgi:hypothetical protein
MGGVPVFREDQGSSADIPTGAGGQYSDILTRDAKNSHVVAQPGGGFQVIQDELVKGTAGGGIEGNQRGSDARTASAATADQPILNPANYQSHFDFGSFGTGFLALTRGATNTQVEEEPPSEQSNEISADLDAQLAEIGLGTPSDVGGSGGIGGTGDKRSVGGAGGGGEAVAGGSGEGATGAVGDSTKQYAIACTAEFASTDEAVVKGALMGFIGIDLDPPLTDEQKAALTTLASYISSQNSIEPKPYLITMLQSWDPAVVAATLHTLLTNANTGLTGESLTIVKSYLEHGAANLAACNANSETPAPLDPTFKALNSSTSSEEVYTALLSQIDLTQYSGSEDAIKAQLLILAGRIATANSRGEGVPGIESVSTETIAATITELLGFEADTTIPSNLKIQLRLLAMGLGAKLAAINEQKWTQDSLSTNQGVVFTSLQKLSNIEYNPNLSPQEKMIGMDYLKVLSMALAFMATVRARTAELEGDAEKKLSQGKLDIAKEQVALSKTTYEKTFKEIDTEIAKIKEAKKTQEILRIVMPIVTALMAVISIIVTIVTFGAAAPIVTGIMVVLIAATAAAMVAIQVTDAMNKMCDALGYPDPSTIEDPAEKEKAAAIRAAITFGVQLAAMVVMIAATLGAGAAVLPAMLGMQSVQIFGQIGSIAAQTSAKMLTSMVITMTVSTLMTSGLLTIGITTFLKKVCNASDDVAKYLGLALTILLSILMAVGCFQAGGAIASRIAPTAASETVAAVGTAAAGAIDDVADDAATAVTSGSSTAATGAQATGSSLGAAAESASSGMVMQMLRNIAKRMAEMLKDPFFYTDLAEMGAQAMPQGVTIAGELRKIELTEIQKSLTEIISRSEGLIELLKQTIPAFDMNLQSLQDDQKSMIEFMTSLLNLFEKMVQSASQMTTRLHQAG